MSGTSIFVSSQLSETEVSSHEAQRILNFIENLFNKRPSKKSNSTSSISKSSKETSSINPNGSNQSLIYEMASNDFEILKTSSDRRLFNVQSINWQIRDSEISKQNLENSLSISIDKKSTVALEIEVFSQNEQNEKLTIVQLSYTDTSNGNKVHEFSRMYQIPDKKKPD